LIYYCFAFPFLAPFPTDLFPILDNSIPSAAPSTTFIPSPSASRRAERTLPPRPFLLRQQRLVVESNVHILFLRPQRTTLSPPPPRSDPLLSSTPPGKCTADVVERADASRLCGCRSRNNNKMRDVLMQKYYVSVRRSNRQSSCPAITAVRRSVGSLCPKLSTDSRSAAGKPPILACGGITSLSWSSGKKSTPRTHRQSR